ncbi:MAG: SPOR domain-containing protein [Treponema sp.]|jgi:DedD protein|nr:SPOR domain-containing protein [Treponema sp.]
MEKKKLLLVAISVGVFLVMVIGAAILIFSPRTPSPAAVAAAKPARPVPVGKIEEPVEADFPAPVNAVELVKTLDGSNRLDGSGRFDEVQGLQTPPENKTQEDVFYIYGENPSETVTVDRSSGGAGNRLIVDVPRPSAPAVPDAPRSAPAPVARTSPAPAARAPAAPAPRTAAPAPSRAQDNYWVQTGSFSTVARAEAVKDTLSAKGISSLVENREVDGKTYFRVRVGPYTSKNEADYWLALIKSIHGFEESLVFKTPVR